ncbi:hypothetical protein [Sulfurovum riftiae]|uniref:Zinc-regulated TonB-dependent outer membrane receptor n=1 Tax=Sulfurovum riftiae TaxID=1630136 RepID=A0A151CDY3_9BACT|nr:hypothetical protein [Sulfurovum riftiae]KYJ85737.1 hypothetical protein AS592_03085 [Sulfurovum riftiae]
MKKTFIFSIAVASFLFADSDIEELKKLVMEQQKTIQALQTRVNALESKETKKVASAQNVSQESNQENVVTQKKSTATVHTASKKREQAVPQAKKTVQEDMVQDEYAQYKTETRNVHGEYDAYGTSDTQDSSSSFNQSAFLPGIALIGNMSAVSRNISNDLYSTYTIPGFIGQPQDELPFNEKRGFNLNYGELEIFSTVGPYLDMFSAFHIAKDGIEIGELYGTTRTLPYGLRLKGGKFKSEFGRINSKHQHAWSFSSIPLVFESFFGQEGLCDEGAQLQWVAPTDFYLMAGIEAMQGSNEYSFGDTDGVNQMVAYLKTAVDLTDMTTLLGGVTYMQGKNDFGDTKIYGADLTLRTSFDSYSSLKWQNELLYREKPLEDGTVADQTGLYSELIYEHNQNWSGGVRYDTLFKNIPGEPEPLDRYTAMIMYRPFEFTKLRLQYTYDKSKYFAGEQKNMQEILLDLTFEAGAHGAHAF